MPKRGEHAERGHVVGHHPRRQPAGDPLQRAPSWRASRNSLLRGASMAAPPCRPSVNKKYAWLQALAGVSVSPRAARASARTGCRKSGSGRTRPRPVSRSQICSSWARCSSITVVDQREVGRAHGGQRARVDVDRPVGHERRVHRHVARDLELAQQRAHQADDRGVAGGAGERQVELQVELEEQVLVAEEVVARGELALAVDRLRHHREVVLGGVHRGQLRHARLEQPARLEHAGDLAEADLLAAAQQLARHQLRGDEDAAGLAAADLEHAGLAERLDRLAQGRAADPHLGGQLALGGQPVAGVQVAGLDLLGDLLDGLLERPAGRDGLEGAHGTGPLYGRIVEQLRGSSPGGFDALERLALGHLERRGALRGRRGDRVVEPRPSRARCAPARRRRRRRRTTRPPRGSARRSWRGSPARRGCRAPSASAATARPVSGLLAAPATTRDVDRARQRVVDQPAAGAGREHVQLHARGSPRPRARSPRRARRRSARSARRRGRRPTTRAPAGGEPRGERAADLAEPDHADAAALELVRAGLGRQRRAASPRARSRR